MSSPANRAGMSYLLSSTDSLLERENRDPQNKTTLSEIQSQVDALVSHSVEEATDAKTLVAMVAGGFASRFARMGTLVSAAPFLSKGGVILSLLAQGSSYAVALGAESFTFAGINRELNRFAGHRPTEPFTQEWAHAGITLGALKSIGALTQGENIILQHLATDLGLMAGQNLGASAQLGPKPQGNFLQQMLAAEAMNWQMKGGMSLVHGLAPSLLPMEKRMDLCLKSQEMDLPRPLALFPQLAVSMAGSKKGNGSPEIDRPWMLMGIEDDGNGGTQKAQKEINLLQKRVLLGDEQGLKTLAHRALNGEIPALQALHKIFFFDPKEVEYEELPALVEKVFQEVNQPIVKTKALLEEAARHAELVWVLRELKDSYKVPGADMILQEIDPQHFLQQNLSDDDAASHFVTDPESFADLLRILAESDNGPAGRILVGFAQTGDSFDIDNLFFGTRLIQNREIRNFMEGLSAQNLAKLVLPDSEERPGAYSRTVVDFLIRQAEEKDTKAFEALRIFVDELALQARRHPESLETLLELRQYRRSSETLSSSEEEPTWPEKLLVQKAEAKLKTLKIDSLLAKKGNPHMHIYFQELAKLGNPAAKKALDSLAIKGPVPKPGGDPGRDPE